MLHHIPLFERISKLLEIRPYAYSGDHSYFFEIWVFFSHDTLGFCDHTFAEAAMLYRCLVGSSYLDLFTVGMYFADNRSTFEHWQEMFLFGIILGGDS